MDKVYFVSLGCDKNLCDTEHILFDLRKRGFEIAEYPAEARIIVINTCSFIEDALQESIDTVVEMGAYKEQGLCELLLICGCMGQRFSSEICDELPEVDAVIGTNSWDELCEVIDELLEKKPATPIVRKKELTGHPKASGRLRTDPIPASFLKIAEGCDKRCTYCIIPYIRGGYRSVPMEELLDEARELVASGVTEISLVAQEVTLYGIDIYGKKSLVTLIKKLSEIEGLSWIRLLYCYPEEIDDDLIAEIAENKKLCHYIDMPIQHCNDDILRRMGRRTNKADIVRIVERLRETVPDIAIRTTLITGFPGESEEAHREMIDFVRQMSFDRLGCFSYSREDGTPAADFEDQIDRDTADAWAAEIMEAQRELTLQKNKNIIGSTLSCFVEGRIEDGVYVARSYRDAPGVDASVFIETDEELISGDIIKTKIVEADGYDLIGDT
mgnify:CR=1 FL=1